MCPVSGPGRMTLSESVVEVWRQILLEGRTKVDLNGETLQVSQTRGKGLRAISFVHEGHRIEGIEQNPETKSRWAGLARAGKQIMQFRYRGRYIGNVCDGTLTRYPSWKSLGLGD